MNSVSDGLRVAWLIPEFPRQSHTFFHRELVALRRLGFDISVYSTRQPSKPAVHSWASKAIADTTYLHPAGLAGVIAALRTIVTAGPWRWIKVAQALATADVPTVTERLRFIPLVFYGAELSGLMDLDKLEHVHVQFCSDGAHVALFAKLLGGKSYSISHHEFLAEFGPNQRQKWQHASFAHTISRTHLDELRSELGSWVPADIAVAPMGIEPDIFLRQRGYQSWTGGGEFRIFSCARLTAGKNQKALLLALHRLLKSGVAAHVTLAGIDESPGRFYQRQLEEVIGELELGPHVTMLGQIPEEQVRQQLELSHAFALASLHEGVPVAVMEAMAMSVPVVVTDVGGVRDLVSDKVDGVVVAPGDVDSLFEGLLWLARNPELASSISAVAREKITSNYHSGISAEALAGLMVRNLGE
jgi:glycosyltransferase involved in cell wall biosynthesis